MCNNNINNRYKCILYKFRWFKSNIFIGFGLRTIKESDLGFKLPYRILPGRLSVNNIIIN